MHRRGCNIRDNYRETLAIKFRPRSLLDDRGETIPAIKQLSFRVSLARRRACDFLLAQRTIMLLPRDHFPFRRVNAAVIVAIVSRDAHASARLRHRGAASADALSLGRCYSRTLWPTEIRVATYKKKSARMLMFMKRLRGERGKRCLRNSVLRKSDI